MSQQQHEYILPGARQICLVCKDLDKTLETLSNVLEIRPWRKYDVVWGKDEMQVGNPQTIKAAFADFGAVEMEVVQPIKGDSVWARQLEAKGEGVHHIAVDVQSIEQTAARLAEKGVGIVQWGWKGPLGHAFLDPEKTGGVYFELLQRRGRLAPKRG